MTPADAIRAGVDYIVVGRPILEAKEPVAAARAIVAEMAGRREATLRHSSQEIFRPR
jgi:orotidine-5'-phosphate decarboxylase